MHDLVYTPKTLSNRGTQACARGSGASLIARYFSVWSFIRPVLFAVLCRLRDERLAREAEARLNRRLRLVKTFYGTFKESQVLPHPIVYPLLPEFLAFAAVRPIWEVDTLELNDNDLQNALTSRWIDQLPQIKDELALFRTSSLHSFAVLAMAALRTARGLIVASPWSFLSKPTSINITRTLKNDEELELLGRFDVKFKCVLCSMRGPFHVMIGSSNLDDHHRLQYD